MDSQNYYQNGKFYFTNIAVLLPANVMPENELGQYLDTRWVGTFKLNDDRTHIRPIIYFTGPWNSILTVKIKMLILNTQPLTWNFFGYPSRETYSMSRTRLLMDEEHLEGPEIPISDVLNEENGWLSKGKLSVEYGIEVLAEKRVDGVCRFNFHAYTLFVSRLKFDFRGRDLFLEKELTRFHSPLFEDEEEDWMFDDMIGKLRLRSVRNCLQIVHGVNMRMSMAKAIDILSIAHFLEFHTVLEYCQREIIQRHLDVSHYDLIRDPYIAFALRVHNYQSSKWYTFLLEFAMKLGLRHYLVHLLRDYKSLKSMAQDLKEVDLELATGESMKMIVAMFIYGNNFTRN
uniref:BTB domain-containing protein n=1 Tax=Caenorhabditis tropicalis TaxID=1561998 RepID=A0A1I7UE14_9PELO